MLPYSSVKYVDEGENNASGTCSEVFSERQGYQVPCFWVG